MTYGEAGVYIVYTPVAKATKKTFFGFPLGITMEALIRNKDKRNYEYDTLTICNCKDKKKRSKGAKTTQKSLFAALLKGFAGK